MLKNSQIDQDAKWDEVGQIISLTLLHSERPKLYAILAFLSAIGKEGVFDDNFSYLSLKPYVLTPHLNHFFETVQMRGQNICFYAELP